jgi:hypothetical protein
MSPTFGAGLYHDNKLAMEIVPNDADVLLGRGTVHQQHPGNVVYNGKEVKTKITHRSLLVRWIRMFSHTLVGLEYTQRSWRKTAIATLVPSAFTKSEPLLTKLSTLLIQSAAASSNETTATNGSSFPLTVLVSRQRTPFNIDCGKRPTNRKGANCGICGRKVQKF